MNQITSSHKQFCKVCQSPSLEEVIDLGMHPCADTFLKSNDKDILLQCYPLIVDKCLKCGHMQNRIIVPPEERYCDYDYSYTSDHSATSISHFEEYANYAAFSCSLTKASLVLEPGSNIGQLLGSIKGQTNARVIGYDPSPNISELANANGIETKCDFFALDSVTEKDVDLIIGANVLNHMDNPHDLFLVADKCLSQDGSIIMEVPYSLDIINDLKFDTIYHEHANYFSISSLNTLASFSNFKIIDVQRIDYMGGSLRIHFKRLSHHTPCFSGLDTLITDESIALSRSSIRVFQKRVLEYKLVTLKKLNSLVAAGNVVCGIGAATKGNTLLNYLGLDSTTLTCIADVSPLKIGKYTPGSRIPIVSEKTAFAECSHAFILAWNLRENLEPVVKSNGLVCV